MRPPRGIVTFWLVALLIAAGGAAWLQVLGPPEAASVTPATMRASIPPPAPALLRSSRFDPAWRIPRPGKNGPMPRRYYAAPASAPAGTPRMAVMVAGIGYALATGMDAVNDLPPAVSLAFSPYGSHLQAIAKAARQDGHETLMGIPMHTAEEPAVTAGDKALSGDAAREDNARHLDWTLSRVEGYAGVTDTIGLDAPEVFLTDANEARWLLGTVAGDGLFFVSTRRDVAMPEGVAGRAADTVIAPAAGAEAERRALAAAAARAKTTGTAIVVLTNPAPASIKILAAWCATLAQKHLALVPVSALAEGK